MKVSPDQIIKPNFMDFPSSEVAMQDLLNQMYYTKDTGIVTGEKKNFRVGKVLGNSWLHQATGGVIEYRLCIMEELKELYDELGVAHYRPEYRAQNEDNARMEIVDILHFVLSHTLVLCNGVQDDAEEVMQQILREPNMQEKVQFVNRAMMLKIARGVLEADPGSNPHKFGSAIRALFFVSSHIMGIPFGDLVKDTVFLYRLKFRLNIFRVVNGYMEGQYIKKFKSGTEDNAVLMDAAACHVKGHDVDRAWELFVINYIYCLERHNESASA